ncbi:uncharacterized protein LAESUDRAFT_675671 [Laetiporus sulphureus 93-53]|uniref:Xylosidase/arabinosidase n=1 Tax=Laetiporus sulphureus 93-53 TaxID=1314785 RepID=A0A165FJJ3_9APHY|nr:uncharacterized protein LAESUDRAFT_675671 [Laetiporus sulphureus 93-53]KZT09069.1 hypothetical protein LAESUDRAFT_675671 [Laetiporus sulphureus 93-53]
MAALSSVDNHGRMLKRADPSTIQDKFMVGYQGWFTCAGDGPPLGPGHHGWLHWFNYPIPDGGRPNTDLWPDLSEYSPSELYPAPGLKYPNGEQVFLFSSRHPRTVQRHFHWMAQHGVDGAFLQRFAGQTDLEAGNEAIRNQRDEVGDRVREAAEKEGRVFAIMYDVSGVPPDRIQRVIEHDWMHLIHDKGVLDSPNYLREHGKAVVTFWGFGFADSGHDPAVVRAITTFVRNNTPGGAYIMAGTPAHWRTSVSDADTNPEFVKVWLEAFDAISPWTIGRYHNEETNNWFEDQKIKGDVELINERNRLAEQGHPNARHIDYIPVVFPGGSGHNLSEGKWKWNDAPRQGGRFLWRQLYNVRRHGVRTIYGAMWDEYDEGTAYLPVVPHKSQLPVSKTHKFMALDEDGYDLPSDWYMRVCCFAAESLRGERTITETFPEKELRDYWSSHPRYEEGISRLPFDDECGKQNQAADQRAEGPPPPYNFDTEGVRASAPIPPPSTRPISSSSSTISSGSSSWQPPPINPSSRPTSSGPGSSSQSLNLLVDDFSRQSISDGKAARFGAPPLHPNHPAASRSVPPEPWSQWPPSQWGARPPPPPRPTYTPSYLPAAPPPPLRPRPSASSGGSQFGDDDRARPQPPSQHQTYASASSPPFPQLPPNQPYPPEAPYQGYSYSPGPSSPPPNAGYYSQAAPPGALSYQAGPPYGGYGAPPPPRPGSYPYPGQAPAGRPSPSSNPLEYATSMVNRGEVQLKNLANAGTKFWNKRTK